MTLRDSLHNKVWQYYDVSITKFTLFFLNQAFGQHAPGFLKLLVSTKSVCVCVCVFTPEGINNYSREMNP